MQTPLTIQYCSDLHLEFDLNRKWMARYPLQIRGEVLLLAGDVVPFALMHEHAAFLDFVAANYKAVYWVPGNHEYYGADVNIRSGTVYEAVRDNVFLVNNTTVHIAGTDIICSTLWSHINIADEWQITRAMSDFHVIGNGNRKLDIPTYNQLHRDGRAYVEQALAQSTAAHKVVVTHHIPTFMHYPEKYRGDIVNQAFATELHDLVYTSGADCWIYGHHHCNIPEYTIGNTRMLTNQLGYVRHGEHKDFDNGKIITLV